MAAAPADIRRRVKLYALNSNRQWDDKGTGHVTSCYHEQLDGMSLLVRNESDGSLLLESKIHLDTQYQKQQGTLIVWTESDNYDLALSFQERDGCNEIWEKICQVQGKDPLYEQDQDDEQEEIRINLVDCDYENLNAILNQITAFGQTTKRRDALASEYLENDYIRKLIELFRKADERQDLSALHTLYEIFKHLFLYDRTSLTEAMLSEQILMDVIGVFEYEPAKYAPKEVRESIKNNYNNQNTVEMATSSSSPPSESMSTSPPVNEAILTSSPPSKSMSTSSPPSESMSATSPPRESISASSPTHESMLTTSPPSESMSAAVPGSPPASTSMPRSPQPTTSASESPPPSTSAPESPPSSTPMAGSLPPSTSMPGSPPPATSMPASSPTSSSSSSSTSSSSPTSSSPHSLGDRQSPPLETASSPPQINRKRHREFLLNDTTFKEVIPLGNPALINKIHQLYRVQYLQSSVLPTPSVLEENAYTSLTNIVFFNKVEIVQMIQENGDFLQELFSQIISNETSIDRKRELVLFLREYCIFSQTIQPKQREAFFKTLASLKILSAVEVALSNTDPVMKSAAIDIFTYLVEYNPHMTREHAVQQKEGIADPQNGSGRTENILKLVIEHITTDQDPELGTATQLSCMIRLLLDPENAQGETENRHLFLEFFYYSCMQSLVEPIENSTTPSGEIAPSADDRKTAQMLSIMLELLTFFMEHYYDQMRTYFESSDLLTRIITLVKSRHKFLVLGVIRFFRRLMALKEDIHELIINKNLIEPIVQVLKDNNGRYNLVDSAILELFEFITSEGPHNLIDHILTNFGPFLESIEYVNTFKVMRQKKETHQAAIRDNSLKSNGSSIENPQMYFPNYPRRDLHTLFGQSEADVDDVGEEVDADKDDMDSDNGTNGSDPDSIELPELEFTMNVAKNDDEEEEDVEDEEEDAEVDDDIRLDDGDDCDHELEHQFKKKRTK